MERWPCKPRVQLFADAGNGWPRSALRYHQLMPVSCHFRDCKALLVAYSCKKRYSKYPTLPLPSRPGKWFGRHTICSVVFKVLHFQSSLNLLQVFDTIFCGLVEHFVVDLLHSLSCNTLTTISPQKSNNKWSLALIATTNLDPRG